MINKKLQHNTGYTLLFAVLVSSVVLAIGISILTISKKEFLLSSSARESSSAFYAADSGLECAVFYNNNFSTTTPPGSVNCMGQNAIVTFDRNIDTFNFDIKMQKSSACAVVKVKAFIDNSDDSGSIPRITIESRGYNLGWASGTLKCDQSSPKRVERALRYTF